MTDEQLTSRPRLLHAFGLAALIAILLVPFAGKAFHIDDPLFIWAAQHILRDPVNFYDFRVHWYFDYARMDAVMMNPPLQSYYLAAVGGLAGFGEVALHLSSIVSAIAVTLGTYLLARRMTSRPVIATVAAVLTPAFLVSASNVMCDVLMLAFWVWAALLWDIALRDRRAWLFFISAILIALSALTKYYGVALVPLLVAYSIMHRRAVGWWMLALLVPVAALAGYEWITRGLYGTGLLTRAFTYPATVKGGLPLALRLEDGLAFAGGGAIAALCFAPRLWSWQALLIGAGAGVALAASLTLREPANGLDLLGDGGPRWGLILQAALMCAAGVSLLALAIADFWRRRDAGSLMLLLWVVGTFTFSTVLNWSVTARTMLPMVPAVGILIARRLDSISPAPPHGSSAVRAPWHDLWPLLPATAAALAAVWADYTLANSARQAARDITTAHTGEPRTLRFQGHWGFQYYLEQFGAKPMSFTWPDVQHGETVVIPRTNTNVLGLPAHAAQYERSITVQPARWVATMSPSVGAAFYSNLRGPLPFAFGPAPPERYELYIVRRRITPEEMGAHINDVVHGRAGVAQD